MPFVQNFSISQTPSNPALVIAEDTSTGADAAIVSRRITFTDSAGNTVVPSGTSTSYVAWALATNPITITLLTSDMAFNITVQWLDVSNTVLYTKSETYCLAEYNKSYLYYLIAQQAQAYPIIQDTNYWSNVGIFWVNIIGAIKAVELANDIASSQASLNRSTFMQQNANLYF
jgi:hypothetical protein